MTLWGLVAREIAHRKLNFTLGVLGVAVAGGVITAALTVLRAHDLCTEDVLGRKEGAAEQRLAVLEDDYRKTMKELGFNVLVLPRGQELAEFWEKGYAEHTMPEAYVTKLANSKTALIQHLLPIVQKKVLWEEQKRRVILVGTRGEAPASQRGGKKEPMLLAVPKGQIVVGAELARDLSIKPGDKLTFLGRELTVQRCLAQRGSADDATVWVDLAAAQEMLGMAGRINLIEALKCYCKGVTSEQVAKEIAGYLDNDVKVVLRENEVLVRERARERAAEEHAAAIAAERASRGELRRAREALAAVVAPVVVLGAAVWTGLLALGNVRERRGEIGILRAIGLRSGAVFRVFLLRALLVGTVGAAVGYAGGLAASMAAATWAESMRVPALSALVMPGLGACVLAAAPLLSALASWAPATLAAREDPAAILQKE
jgi:hypothetical protein